MSKSKRKYTTNVKPATEFGQMMERYRTQMGMTLHDFVQLIPPAGVTESAYREWRYGHRTPAGGRTMYILSVISRIATEKLAGLEDAKQVPPKFEPTQERKATLPPGVEG